jgi:hypothetical protein
VAGEKSVELRVSVDVGYRRHSVAMGLSSGEVLEEFEIEHPLEGFEDFFSRIEKHSHQLAGRLSRPAPCGSPG